MPPIFPQVKSFKPGSGRFSLRGAIIWHGRAATPFQVALLRESLPGHAVQKSETLPDFCVALGYDEPTSSAVDSYKSEEYRILSASHSVVVTASTARGLTYGIFSLKQWVDYEKDSLPGGEVRDWPDLQVRAVHLDLKGSMWRQEVLLERLQELAELKVNMLVVEYEDKFPYASHPDLRSPEALTRLELDAFLSRARDLNLEVVPLLQCFGHVESILRHKSYAHLREEFDPVDALHHLPANQFCPLKEEAAVLFEDLATELLVAHPDTLWFHVGADEARDLGRCPECAALEREQGREELVMRVLRRASAFLGREGKEVMVWDDMFREMTLNPDRPLPENLAFNCWLYYTDLRLREEESFGFLDKIVSLGRPVFGASAARGADGAGPELPVMRVRLDNNLSWAQVVKARNLAGIFITAWGRYTTLTLPCESLEGAWPALACSAGFAWTVPPRGNGDNEGLYLATLEAYLSAYHGIESPAAAKAILALRSKAFLPAGLTGIRAGRNVGLWDWLKRVEQDHVILDSVALLIEELDNRFYRINDGNVDDGERSFYLARLKRAGDALIGFESELKPLLGHLYRPASVREYLSSRLDRLRYRMTSFMVMLGPEGVSRQSGRRGSDQKTARSK